MLRKIRRNQLKAQKASDKRQQRLAAVALGGLLILSPNFILPPQVAAVTVTSEGQLNTALTANPVDISFGGNISATANLSANTRAASISVNGGGYLLNGNGNTLLQFSNTGGITLNLNNLTLSGGSAVTAFSGGAGMYLHTMTGGSMAGNSFAGHAANNLGGGAYLRNMADGSLTNNSFSNNYAVSGGGGVYVSSMSGGSIAANSFTGNSTNSAGGGLYASAVNDGSVNLNSFTANSANYGGGMYVSSMSAGSIGGNIFSANSAARSGGGAFISSMADASLSGNTFANNQAAYYGGGAYVSALNGGSVANNALSGNTANSGGGMFVSAMASGSITGNLASANLASNGGGGGLTVWNVSDGSVSGNSLISNSATNYGGGMFVYTMTGGSIAGNTFTSNSANSGGGMFVSALNGGQVASNILTGNSVTSSGGGMWVGNISNGGSVTANSLISNTANSHGGGMWAYRVIDGGLTYNIADANSASYGGGMYVYGISGGRVDSNSLTGNTAASYGGGMYVYSMIGGSITGNTFTNNSANSGGGVFISAISGGNVKANDLTANTANSHGGGMYVWNTAGGSFTGNNLHYNSAAGNGGGMYIWYGTKANLADNAFISNQAGGYGGAIYYRASAASGALSLSAASGQKVEFIGNQHKAGLGNFTPNSIYFAIDNNAHNSVSVAVQVEEGGQFIMQDPMMSQAPTAQRSVAVNVEKTGDGMWQLAGHNQMQGPSIWTIAQGSLQLISDTDGSPAHIDLSDVTASQFNLAANAVLGMDAPGNNSHQISAQDITLADGSVLRVNTAGLSVNAPALKINTASLNLPGTITVDSLNAGALDGSYTLVEEATGTIFSGKVQGLFDGQSSYMPINRRYAATVSYDLSQPGQIIIEAIGADIARQAIWNNDSGDGLWNLTSENWLLTGSTEKYFKAGDSPIFSGSPDGQVMVDGVMQADHMQVQSGSYTFSPYNSYGDGISGQQLDISGGSAAFDVPLAFIGDGSGKINVARGASMLLAPGSAVVTHTFEASGALTVVPIWGGHVIDASVINFNPGSQVGVSGFSYGPQLTNGAYTVLSLVAPSIANNSDVPVTSGIIQVGAYDYQYHNLYWDGNRLVMLIDASPDPPGPDPPGPVPPGPDPPGPVPPGPDPPGPVPPKPTPNPERMAASAITGPLAIAAQMTPGTWLMPRFKQSFKLNKNSRVGQNLAAALLNPGQLGGLGVDGVPDLLAGSGCLLDYAESAESSQILGDAQPHMLFGGSSFNGSAWKANASGGGDLLLSNSLLWFTPAYSDTDQSGRSGYNIKTPAWAAGYEQWFGHNFFLGLAVAGSLPEYESAHADIDAKNLSAALYGGTALPWNLDLGAFITYGQSNYDQTRRVQGEIYGRDYDSANWGFGLNIGRDFWLAENGLFALRPFASYEYLRLDVDGYNEGQGAYALNVGSHKENLHFLRAGLDGTVTAPDSGAYATGRIYYAGLYGDREAEATAFFTADPANPFASAGDALDRHSLGLGFSAGLPLGDNLELQATYNFLAGEDNATHQGSISIMFKF